MEDNFNSADMEPETKTNDTSTEQSKVGSKSFLVVLIGLGAIILIFGALLAGYLYGLGNGEPEDIQELPRVVEDPIDPNYEDDRSDPIDEPDQFSGPLEEADNSRSTYTTDLDCVNPYTIFQSGEMQEDHYTLSVDIYPYEEVKERSYGCGYSIGTDTYSLNVEVTYEGVGYMVASKEQMPEVEIVEVPLLNIDFPEGSDQQVKRLKNPYEEATYDYSSYFQVGSENCTQWTSSEAILACGVSGITLEDAIILVTCKSFEEDVPYCDKLLETLSVEKVQSL